VKVGQGLAELREALLHLHKALIESERAGYEKTFGRIASRLSVSANC